MDSNSTPDAPIRDRRIRRSRAALMQATVTLVSERGTAAVPISDIAEAADVSRPVVYQHFGDRDKLLLESALDLAKRELLPRIADNGGASTRRGGALALVKHFADHRAFYRAVLTSSCAFALNKALTSLLIPINRQLVQEMFGQTLGPPAADDYAAFITGGGATLVNTWIIEGAEPLDPEAFADRLMQLVPFATDMLRLPGTPQPHKEPVR
ncbi:TetR/AcrR family transcriptional regulator [Arthrobacter sp. ISL-48]|uniref:TetR/AcrR family transcriptional regulator n=1 Tax=Arthrobacter sp. ISL-48 TaxID=2819110 RepID=UPI001BEA1E3B|nr:TetR/AcrR family transcriptional regulator [Arthrobacter sp. ISL-48]MBT2533220.1 TetR/AcrR family transcriptional regulator [Arthrobacter sp. ISL-48]